MRSLAWANAASAIPCGSVRWHAVEVDSGGQEVLAAPLDENSNRGRSMPVVATGRAVELRRYRTVTGVLVATCASCATGRFSGNRATLP